MQKQKYNHHDCYFFNKDFRVQYFQLFDGLFLSLLGCRTFSSEKETVEMFEKKEMSAE